MSLEIIIDFGRILSGIANIIVSIGMFIFLTGVIPKFVRKFMINLK